MARGRHGARGGFSTFEVLMAVGILGLVLASAARVMTTASNAYRANRAVRRLEQNAHRALHRVATELAATGADYLDPAMVEGLPYPRLEYQPLLLQGKAAVPGPVARLALELEPGELDDGLDNDGDGLVDEGQLVLTRGAGGAAEQRVVLCSGVRELLEGEGADGLDENGNGLADEPGFHLLREGPVLTMRLTVTGLDPQGRPLARTVETSTKMRN